MIDDAVVAVGERDASRPRVVPMKLPRTMLPVVPVSTMLTPLPPLPEMTFRAPATVPPITLSSEPPCDRDTARTVAEGELRRSHVGADEVAADLVAVC